MKNLFDDVSQDKIEVLKQTEIEKKRVFVQTLKPKRGHILFEFDLVEKVVRRAEFVKPKEISFLDAMETGGKKISKEVDGKENCVYVSALNQKNAEKKFLEYYGL